MKKFSDENINEFLNDLASDMPSPGGGAVAGFVSALSAALNSMVYSLTVGKKSYLMLSEDERKTIDDFREKSERFTKRSLQLMENDRTNFMKLMDCFKLSKETDDEKKTRNESIKQNTIKAMETPLILARESLSFYDNLDVMLKYGNKMLLSDLSISAILLHSAIESSIVNVKVNLNSLKSESFFNDIDKEIKDIACKSEILKNKICNEIDKIIYSN